MTDNKTLMFSAGDPKIKDAGAPSISVEMEAYTHINQSAEALQAQANELQAHGIAIAIVTDDDGHHYYSYKAGDELIAPVTFQESGFFRFEVPKGLHQESAVYIALSKGRVLEQPPEFGRTFFTATDDAGVSLDPVVIEYTVVVSESQGLSGSDTESIKSFILKKIKHDLEIYQGGKNADALLLASIRHNDHANEGQRKFTVYVGVNKNIFPDDELARKKGPPYLEAAYCPEWIQHAEKVEGEKNTDGTPLIAGWEIIPQSNGKYLAIPREEIKDRVSEQTGEKTSHYEYNLTSKLGSSAFMNGDDPKRLLRGVKFIGMGGVVGLQCPVFELDVYEIPKTPDSCLEWVEEKTQKEISTRERLTKLGEGYLLQNKSSSVFRYIGPSSDASGLTQAKESVAQHAPEKSGYTFVDVGVKQTVNDPVCQAYQLFPQYEKIPDAPKPGTKPKGKSDVGKIKILFPNDENKRKNLEELTKLGRIRIIPPLKTPQQQQPALIRIILQELHEDDPNAQEIMFVVDQSGSMSPYATYVAEKFDEISAELAASKNEDDENGLGLIAYTSDDTAESGVDLLVPLQTELEDALEAQEVRKGLQFIAANTSGGLEYTYEAAWRALDEFERTGNESLKKIIVLTDEGTVEADLQVKPGGLTPEQLKARAEQLGVEFIVIFIPPVENFAVYNHFTPPSKSEYLDYLDLLDVNPADWTQEKRTQFWLDGLNSSEASLRVKAYIIELLEAVPESEKSLVVQELLKRLDDTFENQNLQVNVFKALGVLNTPKSQDAIVDFVLQTPFESIKADCIRHELSNMNLPIRNMLYAFLNNPTHPMGRRITAAHYLAWLGDERSVEILTSPAITHCLAHEHLCLNTLDQAFRDFRPALLQALEDHLSRESIGERRSRLKFAIASLKALEEAKQRELQTPVFETIKQRAMKEGILEALKQIKQREPEHYLPALISVYMNPYDSNAEDSERYAKLMEEIIAFGDEAATHLFEKYSSYVATPRLLEAIGGVKAEEYLRKLVQKGEPQVQPNPHRIFDGGQLTFTKASLEAVVTKNRIAELSKDLTKAHAALNGFDTEMKVFAAIALAQQKDDAAIPVLLEQLFPWDDGLVELIKNIGSEKAGQALLFIFKNKRSWLEGQLEKIIKALEETGTPDAIPALSDYLIHQDEDLFEAAANAISAISERNGL